MSWDNKLKKKYNTANETNNIKQSYTNFRKEQIMYLSWHHNKKIDFSLISEPILAIMFTSSGFITPKSLNYLAS